MLALFYKIWGNFQIKYHKFLISKSSKKPSLNPNQIYVKEIKYHVLTKSLNLAKDC